MVLLESHDIVKEYREGREVVSVLKGVSLELDRGETLALEGPSGSGKTTLLFIFGCLLTASAGRVKIDGWEIDPGRPRSLPEVRRRSIGFVFQHYNLFPALSAVENVEYALNIKGTGGTRARRDAERWIESVGLGDRRNARPRDLSGGEKQRVAIARALAGPAPLILADEPTGNLDAQAGEQILHLFRRLARQEGRALLIVTHDPKVRAIADRVARIQDGRLVEPLP
jgi:putative ABC transport system ATP-binding protein